MSDVFSDNRSLAQDPLITLFQFDYTTSIYYSTFPSVSNFYFTNNSGGSLTFGGNSYHATGCQFQSDTITIDGKIPRATMDLDLQDPSFRSIINYSQLNVRGTRVKVIYTRKKYLSVPTPVLNQHYEQEIWYMDSVSSFKKGVVSFILTTGIALEKQQGSGNVINNGG